MKTYQLFWGIYLQWTKQFKTDEEAIKEAQKFLKGEDGWRIIRHEIICVDGLPYRTP